MPISININHARRCKGDNTAAVVANPDGTATITTSHEIGYRDGSGNFVRYGEVITNVYVVPAIVAGPLIAAIEAAIAAQHGLNLSQGDTVAL